MTLEFKARTQFLYEDMKFENFTVLRPALNLYTYILYIYMENVL